MKQATTTLAAFVLLLAAVPAGAHTATEITEFELDWISRVQLESALTPALLTEWIEFQRRHEPITLQAERRSRTVYPVPESVEHWRELVAVHFPAQYVDEALRVVHCESRGDPNATNASSGAAGLFQHLPRYWSDRSARAGVPGADIYEPTANVIVAAWLLRGSISEGRDPWAHWVCKP